MIELSNGYKLSKTIPSLEGHHGAFKLTVEYGLAYKEDVSISPNYVIRLTSHAENYYSIVIGCDGDEEFDIIDDIVQDQTMAHSQKLKRLISFAVDKLNAEEKLKLYELIYKAGRDAGKVELRKRFKQLMSG